jgi:membrane glycosyltransferase
MGIEEELKKLPPDKLLHLKLGGAVALFMLAVALIAVYVGIGYAVAVGSIGLAIGVEWYQKKRNEGSAEFLDALAGSLVGVLLGVAIEVVRYLKWATF